MRKIFIILPLAILALLTLPTLAYTHNPSERHATVIVLPTPTETMGADGSPVTDAHSLPTCTTEDGAGQALCWWDAQRQGNGQGNSVVSGDCAPSIMGDQATSSLCVNLHSRDSETVDNGDGSSHTVPNGPDLIAECLDIDSLMSNADKVSEGWSIRECIKAQMNG